MLPNISVEVDIMVWMKMSCSSQVDKLVQRYFEAHRQTYSQMWSEGHQDAILRGQTLAAHVEEPPFLAPLSGDAQLSAVVQFQEV